MEKKVEHQIVHHEPLQEIGVWFIAGNGPVAIGRKTTALGARIGWERAKLKLGWWGAPLQDKGGKKGMGPMKAIKHLKGESCSNIIVQRYRYGRMLGSKRKIWVG